MDKVVCTCGHEFESEFAKEDWATCPDCDMPIKYADGIKKMRDENAALRAEVERIRHNTDDSINILRVEYAAMKAANNALQDEVDRVRAALEWALSHGSLWATKYSSQGQTSASWSEDITPELRRRAGRE